MSIIHGDVTRVYEIQKDAYTQHLTEGAVYVTDAFVGNVLGLSTGFFDMTTEFFPQRGSLLSSVNISTNSTAIQRIYLIKFPEGTVLFDAYFRYDSQKQFFLGEIEVNLTTGEYIRVYLENNQGIARIFQGTILWFDPPGRPSAEYTYTYGGREPEVGP